MEEKYYPLSCHLNTVKVVFKMKELIFLVYRYYIDNLSILFFYIDNLNIFSLKLLVRAGFKSMWQTLVEGKMLWNFMTSIM